MGLFGSPLEKRLEKEIVPVFLMMGESPSQAQSSFAKLLREVKAEAVQAGTLNAPENGGDVMLQRERTDENTRAALAKLRSEGVRDQDIKNWWNQSDLERRLAVKLDELPRAVMFIVHIKQGRTPPQAAEAVRKVHALYGDPEDDSLRNGEDRPLPIELRRRINDYVQQNWMNRPQQFKESLEACSSFNAWIRSQMKAGLL
jgi:hypothetical protein